MDTEEAVPAPTVFEEVDDDQAQKSQVSIAFRHTADGGNDGVVFALKDGEDVNVVVEEGGSTASDVDGQPGSGYTMIRHDEVKAMRDELEQAKQTVERQIIEMEKAKEMMIEQELRITELEEDKKKHEMGRGQGSEKSAPKGEKEEKINVSSLKGRIEDLEKTVENLKKVVRDKEEQLHQKELMMLQKDADHDIVKTMNISEVSTLKKILNEEREKRVIAEMQVKMLLSSIDPLDYLNRARGRDGNETTKDSPCSSSSRIPLPPAPASITSVTANVPVVGDDDGDDDDVQFIEEVEKECTSGEVADADSGHPRCDGDSEIESEKVKDLMKQKFVCKECGLVCTTRLNLRKHNRITHGLPAPADSHLQSGANLNSAETETVAPISGPSTFISPHNLRRRNPSGPVPINDIRRSSSSSATSSASGNWSSGKNTNFGKTGNGKFICTLCEERYPIVSKLKTHMKHSHGIEDDKFSIGCKDCGIIFDSRRAHIFHRRITHGTKYNGRSKSLTRPGSSGLPPSLPVRNDEEPPVPPPEASSSASPQTFQRHAVDVKRLKFGFYCTCGLEFRNTGHIKIHIKLSKKRNRMAPKIPAPPQNTANHEDTGLAPEGEEFESNMIVDENGMRILTIQPPQQPPPPPSSPIQQRHRIVGVDPKVHRAKYHCSCGKVYYNRASFQIHAKSKNMGRIFKCGWCTMSFDLHGNLKSHVRTYHKAIYGNGKFACGNCAQTFDNSRQLSRHRRQDCMKK